MPFPGRQREGSRKLCRQRLQYSFSQEDGRRIISVDPIRMFRNFKQLRFSLCMLLVVVVMMLLYFRSRKPSLRNLRSSTRVGDASLYPPPATPGVADSRVTQQNIYETICISGYSAKVRPPVSLTNRIKRERMVSQALPGTASDYELDHIIPLELGGCPDCEGNLWMEPWSHPGAHEKDRVEDYLHREVCQGRMSLGEAQRLITSDWYAVYRDLSKEQ